MLIGCIISIFVKDYHMLCYPICDGFMHSRESKAAGRGTSHIALLCDVAMKTSKQWLILSSWCLVARVELWLLTSSVTSVCCCGCRNTGGKRCCLVCASSMRWCRNDASSDHSAGTYLMSSMNLTFASACDRCRSSSWPLTTCYVFTACNECKGSFYDALKSRLMSSLIYCA